MVAANASPNVPLKINTAPVRTLNVKIRAGPCLTGLPSPLSSRCGFRWSPLLLTLCIAPGPFPTVPIRHLGRYGCQLRRDDIRQ